MFRIKYVAARLAVIKSVLCFLCSVPGLLGKAHPIKSAFGKKDVLTSSDLPLDFLPLGSLLMKS